MKGEREMSNEIKPIILRDTETNMTYTLEFSRETVRFAEMRGFDVNEVAKYPVSKLPELFYYAFRMHHKSLSRQQTDKILFEDLGGMPDGMMERLVHLYALPYDTLIQKEDAENRPTKMTVEF